MSRRRAFTLHRSLTFWLGLLGLCFLFWAWWHSATHGVYLGRPTVISSGFFRTSTFTALVSSDSRVILLWPAEAPPAPAGSSHVPQPWRVDVIKSPPSEMFPRAQWGRVTDDNFLGMGLHSPHHELIIPYWVPVIPYLTAWAALIVWRNRRLRRQTVTLSVGGLSSRCRKSISR